MAQSPPTDRRYEELRLRFPLKEGSESIDVLYVLRPRGKEMRLLPMPSSTGMVLQQGELHPLACKLACLTLDQLESLEFEDYSAVMAIVSRFIQESPPTGARPSPASRATSSSGEKTS